MPKHAVGPFPELDQLTPVDVATAPTEDVVVRMQLVHDVLTAQGCKCNGDCQGSPRDPDWGADISELVSRAVPHEILGTDDDGNPTTEMVAIKLETLVAEIDSNGEVCAWLYEES